MRPTRDGGVPAGPQVVQQQLGRDRVQVEVRTEQPAAEGQQVIAIGPTGPRRVVPIRQVVEVVVHQLEAVCLGASELPTLTPLLQAQLLTVRHAGQKYPCCSTQGKYFPDRRVA